MVGDSGSTRPGFGSLEAKLPSAWRAGSSGESRYPGKAEVETLRQPRRTGRTKVGILLVIRRRDRPTSSMAALPLRVVAVDCNRDEGSTAAFIRAWPFFCGCWGSGLTDCRPREAGERPGIMTFSPNCPHPDFTRVTSITLGDVLPTQPGRGSRLHL